MTASGRQDGFPVGGTEVSPEQRIPEWGDDRVAAPAADADLPGIDPAELAEEDLIREVQSLHRTRLDTLRHATDSALANHLRRTAELETEYLARYPGREVDPNRLRDH
ncbi:hypothetical protein SAMN05443287_10353 [Micromonospora phaseoli]|uniref:Uncharacterized protein n=1 Tax=Micromonospora phaseoli TaxID=1144548 RepID=A0A1H6W7H3_9ACTN|nr:DUF6158 family protein [Micromonospora phaseoli]PZW01687.1 hypothetical protein CLV64_10253 [Micromonospora phaseoli]GIJ80826.1 hypothetical protein Xph01_52580 [Micromonospora phaseoli]SEJ12928.1 hypothetical protein SAMN05443287_10353 [Micromonospora phaseoli]